MRISDWSSDVCSSDLRQFVGLDVGLQARDRKVQVPVLELELDQLLVHDGVVGGFHASELTRAPARPSSSVPRDARPVEWGVHEHDPAPVRTRPPHRARPEGRARPEQAGQAPAPPGRSRDRKSGVWGKRVSVRVEPGGGGYIKKKKKNS